jgi:protease-4
MSILKNVLSIVIVVTLLPLIPAVFSAAHSLYQHHFDPRTAVAVVPIKGLLCDSGCAVKHLQTYFKDPSIKAILLKIECSGSTSGTGQAIFYEIQELKKEHPKPLIALVENICVSGGYYIACGADYIIATPSSLIGSIGVRFNPMAQFQLKEFIEQYKIKCDPSAAGEYKLAGDLFAEQTPAHKKMLQDILDDTYQQFVADVATARKISPTQANVWANGKIFTGRQALKLGLIDQIGVTSTAITVIKEKALIEGEIRWIHPDRHRTLLSFLMGSEEDDKGLLTAVVNSCCSIVENRYNKSPLQL